MNDFAYALGLSAEYGFVDVLGFDDELLQMVPQPTKALLLLFPITEKSENAQREEKERIEKGERENVVDYSDVYYMRQTVGNACGTISVFHSILNNREEVLTATAAANDHSSSYLKIFYEKTKEMTPEERAKYIENDTDLENAHAVAVNAGETAVPSIDDKVNLHFIALVERGGHLYELDGRKDTAIDHGECGKDEFLKVSVERVIKPYFERADGSIHFSAVALAKSF